MRVAPCTVIGTPNLSGLNVFMDTESLSSVQPYAGGQRGMWQFVIYILFQVRYVISLQRRPIINYPTVALSGM
jgi:hypothetical protein